MVFTGNNPQPSQALEPCLQAYDLVTQIRPCGPKKDSIRAATFDLLSNKPPHQFVSAPERTCGTLLRHGFDTHAKRTAG